MRFLYISPEADNIFRAGKGIFHKPFLDRDLYNIHVKNHVVEEYPLPTTLYRHLDAAIDAVSSYLEFIYLTTSKLNTY